MVIGKIQKLNLAQPLVLVSLFLLTNCGGGSSGTGTRRIDGSVLSSSALPIEGATVSVIETGVTSTTNQDGTFSLNTEVPATQLTLEVNYANQQVQTSVNVESGVAINVELQITGAGTDSTAAVNEQHLEVDLEGACAQFFDQGAEVIHQISPFEPDTRCRAKVALDQNNQTLKGQQVVLEQRACQAHSNWEQIKATHTDSVGRATLNFNLRGSEFICEYRVGIVSPETGIVGANVLIETQGLNSLTGDQAGQ